MKHFLSTYIKVHNITVGEAIPAELVDECNKCHTAVVTRYGETRTPLCFTCYDKMAEAVADVQSKGIHLG